jgi:L-fuconolactonase
VLITDSQVHVWHTDHPEAIPRHGDRPLTPTDLLAEMRAAGVDRAVLVPPYWVGFDNSFALSAAREHPQRFAVMGRFDIAGPPEIGQVARWRQQSGMLGFRLMFNTPELKPCLHGTAADWFWRVAADQDIPVMLHAPGDMAGIRTLATRYPALRLAVDHLGIGRNIRGHAAFAHIDELLALADLSNVSIKLSTLPIFSAAPYPYADTHDTLHRLFNAFGPQRLFWGSDLSRLPCSYRLCVDLFTRELPWLRDADLASVMGGALCNWLRWPLLPD